MADEIPEQPDPAEPKKPRDWKMAGVAVGIGSAAIVAALLYVNHARKRPEDKK